MVGGAREVIRGGEDILPRAYAEKRKSRAVFPGARKRIPNCFIAMDFDLVQIRTLAEKKEDENFRLVSRTMGMIARTFTCPIVYQVVEELKKSLGFLRRRHH